MEYGKLQKLLITMKHNIKIGYLFIKDIHNKNNKLVYLYNYLNNNKLIFSRKLIILFQIILKFI